MNLAGKILDVRTSEPLPGASVIIAGTNKGVSTGIDGSFSILVSPNDELNVVYLGYKTVREKINKRTYIEILLEEESYTFDEVVVLGYGTETRKANLSVAASNKKISEDIKSRSGNIIESMQGQIAGVTISNNSGDPLSSPTVTIRGMGSRNGDSPLYVVDGVSGAPFNMEDVVSITVLKDAASAAIYGTNVGSGGVILITTKKAQEGKPVVSVRMNYGVQSAWRKPQMLNAEEYVKVRTDAAGVDNVAVPSGIDPNIYPYGQVTRTNWIDEIFRTGNMQRYAVTINGGSSQLKAYASAEYGKLGGTLLNTYSEEFGSKLNIDFRINDRVSLTERINFTYSNGQGGINTSSHTGVTASAMFYPPSATVYDMDKEENFIYDSNGNKQFGGTVPSWAKDLGVAGTFGEIVNPVATLMRLNQNRPSQRVFSTTSLVVNPLTGLKFTSEFSIGSKNYRYENFSVRVLEIGKTNDQNSRTLSYSRTNDWLWENVLSYDRNFDKHMVSAMAGYSMKYNAYNSLDVTLYGFPDEDEYSQHLINGTDWSRTKPGEGRTQESQVSGYARGAYSFDNRYFFTASLRRDASSKLYIKNNSGIFPAVSGAWKISSEKFMSGIKEISLLKLRASWGQIGNVAGVRNYSYSTNLAQTGEYIYLGDNHQNSIRGLGLTTIANKNLKWETSEQTDLGFDIELLSGRLLLSADYFLKNTKDLIDEVPMPSVAGVAVNPLGNVGRVQNSGLEFTLGYHEQMKNNIRYYIDANFSLLKSEVKDLGDRAFLAHSNTIRAMQPLQSVVGQPWYSYYLIKTAGIFQNQAEIDAYTFTDKNGGVKKIQPNAKPGDLKFVDINNDGIINDNDRDYVGSYTPKFTYGLNAGFTFRNFDLNLLIQGVAGNKIFNGVKVMTYAAGQGWNMSKDVLDSWAYNHNSNIPLVSMRDLNGNFSTVSDFFLEDGSYTRIKNLTVGYTFPKLLHSTSSFRVYGSAENLMTITGYSGMDPEVGNNGLDGGTYPISRVFSLGFNLTF
ncbi:SusC/RagA family TonB-linked outer membrane protein [Bacteroidia bacterium]|nr:SusC/RagA family TonB-linked outer membrane protein [Bacteroidia bacterium]